MKKVILILLLLTVVFSAGCIQYGPYPDYEAYETVIPPDAEPGAVHLTIGLGTLYGNYDNLPENLNFWYNMHPEIKDIIYQWADETDTAIREPRVTNNYLEIGIRGKFIDGNPPTVQIRGRYELTEEEKAQFDELYERINEVASKRGMKDIPVQFFYGAI